MSYSELGFLISKYLSIFQKPVIDLSEYIWTSYDFNPLKCIASSFMAQNMIYLVNTTGTFEKDVFCWFFGWSVV